LGDASYSLYLTHTFVLRPFEKWWQSVIGDHAPPWIFLVTATLIAVAVGLLTYRLLERPMTRYLQNRLAARSGRSLNAVLGRAALAMPRLSWQRLNAPHYPPQLPPSV
jgi:peptidoglycan/LPS O-acetylase OafA/YrhL